MPALNFKKQFAPAVESGVKCQTIRASRKRPIHAGDWLYLFTGMRTKSCRKLGEFRCTRAVEVFLGTDTAVVDGVQLCPIGRHQFAEADGFGSFQEMTAFFGSQHGPLPFAGHLIEWSIS